MVWGERNTNNPTLLIVNSNKNLAELLHFLKMKTNGLKSKQNIVLGEDGGRGVSKTAQSPFIFHL